jgi:hypothetical protein
MTLSSVFQPTKPDVRRLSTRALELVLRRLWADAKQELFAPMLCHTCLIHLVRCGTDLAQIARIAGHKRPKNHPLLQFGFVQGW